jgi:hypothetical protein
MVTQTVRGSRVIVSLGLVYQGGGSWLLGRATGSHEGNNFQPAALAAANFFG